MKTKSKFVTEPRKSTQPKVMRAVTKGLYSCQHCKQVRMDRKQSRESGFVSSSSKIESDRIWCRSTFSSLKLIHLSTQKIVYRWLLIVPVLLWFTVQGYNLCYSYMEFSLYLSSYFRIYFWMMFRLYFRINWEEPSLVVNLSLPSFLSLSSSIFEKLNLLFLPVQLFG